MAVSPTPATVVRRMIRPVAGLLPWQTPVKGTSIVPYDQFVSVPFMGVNIFGPCCARYQILHVRSAFFDRASDNMGAIVGISWKELSVSHISLPDR